MGQIGQLLTFQSSPDFWRDSKFHDYPYQIQEGMHSRAGITE